MGRKQALHHAIVVHQTISFFLKQSNKIIDLLTLLRIHSLHYIEWAS